jgi:hypothetical protein
MSEKLRSSLNFLVEEEKRRLDKALSAYANALVLSTDPRGLIRTISVEGVDQSQPMHRILNDLCKVALVTIDIHYSHRNSEIIAHATPLGFEIAQLLKRARHDVPYFHLFKEINAIVSEMRR